MFGKFKRISRIGKKPVLLPEKVEVKLIDGRVTVKGPLGELNLNIPTSLQVNVEQKEIKLIPQDENPSTRREHGLTRALLQNTIKGVVNGFSKTLEIQGLGYRAQNTAAGDKLTLQIGFSHPIEFNAPVGITIIAKTTPEKQNLITITGIDKQLVGEVAADIRRIRPPEPYQGTGIRYLGEYVARKVGKQVAGTTAGAGGGGGAKK